MAGHLVNLETKLDEERYLHYEILKLGGKFLFRVKVFDMNFRTVGGFWNDYVWWSRPRTRKDALREFKMVRRLLTSSSIFDRFRH
jgi:hypothetical protein